jgi:fructoselysine 6-kinase
MKLVALGDCVCDCYLDDGVMYPGGQAVNVAVNAKHSGAEQANFVGVLADDYAADHIRAALKQEDVGTERCRKAYGRTAMPGVRIINGDRVFFHGKRDSIAHLLQMRIAREDLEFLSGFDVCHTTNEAGVDGELAAIHGAVTLSYDFSTDIANGRLERVCPNVDIAFISGAELGDEQVNEVLSRAAALGPKIVIVTRGIHGSVCLAQGERFEQGIVPVDAVDPMGAGDSFAAAFLVSYFDGGDVAQALAFAAERASQTCMVHGAFGHPVPIRHELV